jgi:putative Mg2+ transporter-C (MgtC) family protein
MYLSLSAVDIAIRIVLTVIAAAAIGFERGESGKAAGLRTTLLVGLAACLAMIQTNLLLPVDGKTATSFAVMDVMRLPLGILSGVGFIGAGTILRRNNMVVGVTTAATLWYVTVLGLLFGGGQIWVGIIGAIMGIVVVQLLRFAETRLRRVRRAGLTIRWDATRVSESELLSALAAPEIQVEHRGSSYSRVTGARELRLTLRWRGLTVEEKPPGIVETLGQREGVLNISWYAGEIDSGSGAS